MRGEHQRTPDPNRNLATLEELRAVILALEAGGIREFHKLHIESHGPGKYSFSLETPNTEKSHGRPGIHSRVDITDMDQRLREDEFTQMGERCARAIRMMNDGAGL